MGSASVFNVMGTIGDLQGLKDTQLQDAQSVADSIDLGQLELQELGTDPGSLPPAIYFFHPDHLGSSTVITDGSGYAYQVFLNLPFGETMAEQRRTGTFDNKFKFNGKELDSETGLYYYGARYYNPRTSVWLSVDPMAEKYPGWSPYNYTLQNPVRYIDPDGKAPIEGDGLDDEWVVRKDANGNTYYEKISSLGGDKIDFYHYETGGKYDGMTYLYNRGSGDSNWIKNSKYIHSDNNAVPEYGWDGVYGDWEDGYGSKFTVFNPEHPVTNEIKNSSIGNKMREFASGSSANKGYKSSKFGLMGYIMSGSNMQKQMMGKYNMSFYKVGDIILYLITDAKSVSSWTIWPDGDEVNIDRVGDGNGGPTNPQPKRSTTEQSYFWWESLKESNNKSKK